MGKLFFVLVLFSGAVQSYAQQPTYVDQLKKELAERPRQDTARVNKLIELAMTGVFSLDEREAYMTEALTTSRMLGYATGEAYALTNLWYYKFNRKDSVAADSLFPIAEALVNKSGSSGLKGLMLLRLAQKNNILQNYAGSKDGLLKAEQLLEKDKFYKPLLNCWNAIGILYDVRLSNYPAAMPYYLKSLHLSEQLGFLFEETQTLANLGGLYATIGDRENALAYLKKAADKSKRTGSKNLEFTIQNNLGENYRLTGAYPEAIQAYKRAIEAATTQVSIATSLSNLADVYLRMNNLRLAFEYAFESLNKAQGSVVVAWAHAILARAYLKKGMPDSSIYYARQGFKVATEEEAMEFMRDNAEALANAYAIKQDYGNAYKYHLQFISYRDSMINTEVKNQTALLQYNSNLDKKQAEITQLNQQKKTQQTVLIGSLIVLTLILITSGLLLRNNRQKQKANKLLQQSYNNVEQLGEIGRKVNSSLDVKQIIGTVYQNVNQLMDAAVFGIGIYNEGAQVLEYPATYENGEALPFYTNSLQDENRFGAVCFNTGKEINIGNLGQEYKDHIQEIATPQQGSQPESVIFLPLTAKQKKLGVITVQSFKKGAYSDYHLYMLRNIANYASVAIDNAESYETLNDTLSQLQQTQKQLIQSEKMASLGELTAGIAHEIQNPLNFVNNFSEVNTELIEELQKELISDNKEEVIAIAKGIKENEQKINFHGRRADAIVKGMLQHSRKGSDNKEPTDINALADEYLRLSYHGVRAKDNLFSAAIKTGFDKGINHIKVVPQDIGRVLLNLFTNSFYAMNEKKKTAGESYKPEIIVQTKKLNDKIEVMVKDNGNGIPKKVIDKIFQPFFTTKPTGEGTGLGLSLSYDIIKAIGGEIKVNTTEGEGAEFLIFLPSASA